MNTNSSNNGFVIFKDNKDFTSPHNSAAKAQSDTSRVSNRKPSNTSIKKGNIVVKIENPSSTNNRQNNKAFTTPKVKRNEKISTIAYDPSSP